jgi:hypothetical protein
VSHRSLVRHDRQAGYSLLARSVSHVASACQSTILPLATIVDVPKPVPLLEVWNSALSLLAVSRLAWTWCLRFRLSR